MGRTSCSPWRIGIPSKDVGANLVFALAGVGEPREGEDKLRPYVHRGRAAGGRRRASPLPVRGRGGRRAKTSFAPTATLCDADAVGVEGGAEFVDGFEVFERVVVGFLHVAGVDEGEDDAAEVEGGGDVPAAQDGAGEQAPLAQGVIAQALAELLGPET